MKMILSLTMICLVILSVMVSIFNLLSKKSYNDREKSSPFECGFDPKSSARLPFSLQFFLIAVIFLIFDIEIALLLPFIISMKTSNILQFSTSFMFFLTVLISGLLHEWNQSALEWSL
uniref:NADH-ubiquinone oxidoreductase chain 3 n=1 Tax=Apoderinae sp. 2 AV-2018 TaxID=2480750 RepID=A0A3G2JZA9_9CUCU|nr:NADH dehydrogenase subunit 3 [Apoderinae sp. 2 AV-2018]